MERSIESTQRIESKRKKISYLISIFIVISLCLLVGAKFTGWYEFQTGHGEEVTYSSGAVYGLDSLTVYYDLSNDNYHDPTPYDDLSEYALSQDTFFTNLVFLLMDINSVWFPALVLSIVSIFVFLATLKRGFSIYPSVIINLVAGLAVLTMPLMLNLMIPQGYDYSFMGSSTEHIVETYYTFEKWGPGAGFFISLISGSLLVVSAITMARFHYLWGSVHPKVFLQKRAKPIIISLTTILVAVILIFSYYNIMDLDGDGYVTKDDLFPNNPLEWEDLDKDGVGDNFDDFFAGYPSELVKYYEYDAHGLVQNNIEYRLYPRGGAASDGDRVYIPSGSQDSAFWPYGLYSWGADSSTLWGAEPYKTGSPITTDIKYMNFGREDDPLNSEPWVFFGCQDGRVHAIRDDFDWNSVNNTPSGDDVWRYKLDGEVVGNIAVYNYKDSMFNQYDLFIACTNNGTVYMFSGPVYAYNSTSGETDIGEPMLLWKNHISDGPLVGVTFNPHQNSMYNFFYVATANGELHGFKEYYGSVSGAWDNTTYEAHDGKITTLPKATGNPCIVYFGTSQSHIHAVWGENGTRVAGWSHLENGYAVPGKSLNINQIKTDDGKLTDLYVTPDGSSILIGSYSGFVYSLDGRTGYISMVFNTSFNGMQTQCLAKPIYDHIYSRQVYVPAICMNNTPDDFTDDFTVIYCLPEIDSDNFTWRLILPGRITTTPVIYINNDHIGSRSDLVMVASTFDNSGNDSSRVYCYNCVPTRA